MISTTVTPNIFPSVSPYVKAADFEIYGFQALFGFFLFVHFSFKFPPSWFIICVCISIDLYFFILERFRILNLFSLSQNISIFFGNCVVRVFWIRNGAFPPLSHTTHFQSSTNQLFICIAFLFTNSHGKEFIRIEPAGYIVNLLYPLNASVHLFFLRCIQGVPSSFWFFRGF